MYTIFKIPVVIILAPVLAFTGPHSKAEPGGCRYLEMIIVGLVPGGQQAAVLEDPESGYLEVTSSQFQRSFCTSELISL